MSERRTHGNNLRHLPELTGKSVIGESRCQGRGSGDGIGEGLAILQRIGSCAARCLYQ